MQRVLSKALCLLLLSSAAWAEGTQLWQQSKFEEFEKGTSNGVAISSDGNLQLAPSLKSIYTSPSTYIWQVVSDAQGNAYLGAGSPARVYRVTPDGKASVIFEAKELQVQALAIDTDGTIYAATSPDGRIYKLQPNTPVPEKKKSNKKDEPAPSDTTVSKTETAQDMYKSSVFFDPKTKYIWDIEIDPAGPMYVATGDNGQIFKVEKTGEGSVFFKSDEAHIRCLALIKPSTEQEEGKRNKKTAPGLSTVIAGSDGSGLVYRISPGGEAFVLYSAPKKEITALATDAVGNIFAAAVGEKRAGATPTPQPPAVPAPTPAVASAAPPTLPGQISGGSEIYMISTDGSPSRIWSSRDDLVYALTFGPDGQLLAGTGNRGHIYSVAPNSRTDIYRDLVKLSANQITSMARASNGAVYAVTANLGKLFVLGPGHDQAGTYESDVFDAKSFSQWGRPQVRGSGEFDFFARSGNVDNPDRNWSPWTKIDLKTAERLSIPPARFVQWKVALHSGNPNTHIESVAINYLPKNIAPVIEDINVQVGARITSIPTQKPTSESVNIPLGNAPPATAPVRFDAPPSAVKDRDYIAVRWGARDDNDDDLVYSIYYRGDNERDWKLLKDNITDKYYSWDSSLLPDGGYEVRIVASDAPSHSPDEALSDEKISSRFEVDSTPPTVQALQARLEANVMHISFRAADSFSPIKRAEYSIDAGDWHYVEPVGKLSDSPTEEYDFSAALPNTEVQAAAENGKKSGKRSRTRDGGSEEPAQGVSSSEHVVVVRVWDRFDNMSAAKTVTK